MKPKSLSRAQAFGLQRLMDGNCVPVFGNRDSRYTINGRVAKGLMEKGLARFTGESFVSIGGGFSIMGRAIEITTDGRLVLAARAIAEVP